MTLITITDADDPRIAPYRKLKERDLLHRDGFFIGEGKFILERMAASATFAPVSILLRADKQAALAGRLATVPADVPVYLAAADVMNAIAGFDIHRGILALGRAAPATPLTLDTLLDRSRRIAVLCGISNPENIGSIFRNAAGLGIDAIVLDAQCSHPLMRRAVRVSMGTVLALPWVQAHADSAFFDRLSASGFTLYALTPAAAQDLAHTRFAPKAAILFGEEAHGLPDATIARCTGLAIPMAHGVDSLNVAATSAIVFHALRQNAD